MSVLVAKEPQQKPRTEKQGEFRKSLLKMKSNQSIHIQETKVYTYRKQINSNRKAQNQIGQTEKHKQKSD